MDNNTQERNLEKRYADLPLLILLDEYTKLDINKLFAEFDLVEKANLHMPTFTCGEGNDLIERLIIQMEDINTVPKKL